MTTSKFGKEEEKEGGMEFLKSEEMLKRELVNIWGSGRRIGELLFRIVQMVKEC